MVLLGEQNRTAIILGLVRRYLADWGMEQQQYRGQIPELQFRYPSHQLRPVRLYSGECPSGCYCLLCDHTDRAGQI